jgi:DNA-binding FadR family transcriptional regulator
VTINEGPVGARAPKAAAAVANALRRKIITGTIPLGGSLPSEGVLVEELGVSRPTFRAALRILESEQLITVRRGSRGGAWVNPPTPEVLSRRAGVYMQFHHISLDEVQRARSVFESGAVRLVAQRADPAEADLLEAMVNRERDAILDRDAFRVAALDFHKKLIELSGNKTLIVFAFMIYGVIEEYEAGHVAPNHGAYRDGADRNAEHQRVVELIRSGQAEKAEQMWADHLESVRIAMLEERGADAIVDILS